MPDLVSISWRIHPAVRDDLREVSKRTHIPQSKIIQMGIDMAIARLEEEEEARVLGFKYLKGGDDVEDFTAGR